jgi:hypothetical protein
MHLHPDTSYYSGVVRARLWLQPEELPEQDLVGLDPHKCLAKMNKDRDVEDTIGG